MAFNTESTNNNTGEIFTPALSAIESTMLFQTTALTAWHTPLQLAAMSSQQPTQVVRGSYGPPSIREWVQQHDPNPTAQEIAMERRKRQYNIYRDGQEFPENTGTSTLHPNFCCNTNDRKLAYAEGVSDIKDAVSLRILTMNQS